MSGRNHGEGHSQRCNIIFSYSSIIYWLCQDRITHPPPKLIQGFWEDPWHRVCWEIGKVQIRLSVILNYWTSPNMPPSFLLLFFYSAFTQLEVTSVVLSLQALQFNEDRAAVLIGCLKWHFFFLAEMCFCWVFFFFFLKDSRCWGLLHTSTSLLIHISICVRKIVKFLSVLCFFSICIRLSK